MHILDYAQCLYVFKTYGHESRTTRKALSLECMSSVRKGAKSGEFAHQNGLSEVIKTMKVLQRTFKYLVLKEPVGSKEPYQIPLWFCLNKSV